MNYYFQQDGRFIILLKYPSCVSFVFVLVVFCIHTNYIFELILLIIRNIKFYGYH